MTQHTQWVEVRSDGAFQQVGWRCDGCGQVKWQDEAPDEACDICAEAAPTPETSAPPAETVTPGFQRVADEAEKLKEEPAKPRRSRTSSPPNPERQQ